MKSLSSRVCFFIPALLFISKIGFGQNPQWVNFFTGNSVSQVAVRDSIMWIGTESRLVRTNTLTGTTSFYSPKNEKAFYISDLAVDTNNNVWVYATDFNSEYGRYKFDGTNWTAITSVNVPFPVYLMNNLKFDKKNNLWGIYNSTYLIKYNGNIVTIDTLPPTGGYVEDYTFDSAGNVLLATFAGLIKFDGSNFIKYDTSNSGITDDNVQSIAIDHHQNIWLGKEHIADSSYFDGYQWVPVYYYSYYLQKFDGTNWTSFYPPVPVHFGFRDISVDNLDTVWATCFDSGVFKFDGANWKAYNADNSGLNSYNINQVYVDNLNHKWFATRDIGLIKYDDQTWMKITTANSPLQGNRVWSIGADKNNTPWFYSEQYSGTFELPHGLSHFNGSSWDVYNNDFVHSGYRAGFATDHQGNMWIASDTLRKFDGQNWISTSVSVPVYTKNITIDKVDNVWVAAAFNGLYKVDSNWQVTNYTMSNSGLEVTEPDGICADSLGNIWCGFESLEKFNGVNSWSLYLCADYGISCYGFNHLIADKNNAIWANDDGLVKFDGNSFQVFTTSNSDLPGNSVECLAVDSLNRLWIGTFEGGVTIYDDQTWQTFNTDNSPLISDDVFSILIDKRGNTWIGTLDGLSVYNANGVSFSSVTDVPPTLNFSLYPNPSSSYINIVYSVDKNATLTFTDALGRVAKQLTLYPNVENRIIYTDDLAQGIYLVTLTDGEKRILKKLVIVK